MKCRRNILCSLAFMVMLLPFSGCNNNNDDDDTKSKQELLYDKWWYSIDGLGQGDHLFGSDGTVQIVNPGPGMGTMSWGPNDSLYISFPTGEQYTFWLETIEENYLEYWHTAEPFGVNYTFSTTPPQ